MLNMQRVGLGDSGGSLDVSSECQDARSMNDFYLASYCLENTLGCGGKETKWQKIEDYLSGSRNSTNANLDDSTHPTAPTNEQATFGLSAGLKSHDRLTPPYSSSRTRPLHPSFPFSNFQVKSPAELDLTLVVSLGRQKRAQYAVHHRYRLLRSVCLPLPSRSSHHRLVERTPSCLNSNPDLWCNLHTHRGRRLDRQPIPPMDWRSHAMGRKALPS